MNNDSSKRLNLSEQKLALLASMLDDEGAQAEQELPESSLEIPVSNGPRTGPLPLSYSQRQMWFLNRLEEGRANFAIHLAFRLSGPLDIDALRRSFDQIVARHEILRTTYHEQDGVPVQIVNEARGVELPVVDLSAMPEPERSNRVRKLAQEESWRSFDLSADRMIHPILLKLNKEEYILLLTMHHIASDGWSFGVVRGELAEIYAAACEKREPKLPDLKIQYADVAQFQHQHFESGSYNAQIEYWKGRLAGSPELLHLPTDRPRPDLQTYKGGVGSAVIPHKILAAMKQVSLQYHATLYMTLLSAFQVLLNRYTGDEDLVVGSPMAGRNNPGTETLVGLFSNVLPLRADLSEDPTFDEFLGRTREAALGALANQDVPVEKLVESLALNRSVRHSALFQVMFQLQNLPAEANRLGPVAIEPFDIDPGTAQFDLSLVAYERTEGLLCRLTYNSDVYDAGTAQRMLEHYQTLLESIAANVHERISKLNILPDHERQQVLVRWNETSAEFPKDSTVHGLIEAHARNTPDAVAVEFRGERMTYRELNERANGWAHRFRELGVTRGTLVGLSMQRSSSLMVALLGILKAGGAYVPLDPAYPQQRLTSMFEDAACPVLVTTADLAPRFASSTAKIVCVDQEEQHELVSSAAAPAIGSQPDDFVYVIFTSGSTGKPNGVPIEHRSLVNNSSFFAKHMGLEARDRMLQLNSLSFDTAAEEIFPCWLTGATLVLFPEPKAPSIAEFLEFVEREQITLVDLPTAYWHEWVSEIALGESSFPSRVRAVIIGGEKALAPKLSAWKQSVGARVRLCNTYGPTEATITSTAYDAEQRHGVADPVPIGRPNANTSLYILDRQMQPVPIGVPGELYIGGAGVARGYLNRPELTARRFIPNPFRNAPDPRLYKTGDLVRYSQNGTVEFLGRADDQVKWRGFRIELGEVENALMRYPHTRAAAASLRDIADGQPGLVAYVVLDRGTQLDADDLRKFLRDQLPDHMLPSHYVFLEKMPLSPTGKIDRRALPQPERLRLSETPDFVPPRTDLERQIAAIWMDVLQVDGVGIHNNFFELGGHSLKVVQVLSRIRNTLHVEVPLRRVFEGPTVAEMSLAVLEILTEGLADSDIADLLGEDEDPSGAIKAESSHP